MRRSLRLTMINSKYESPLKALQQRQKRHLREESCSQRPTKRQKLSRGRRSSVIILNDENDFGKQMESKKGNKEVADDSVIIIDDLNNESFARNSTQADDITVVYSSVSGSVKNKKKTNPFHVDKEPDYSNLKMLKGDYPQKWLGDWLSDKNKLIRKSNLTPRKNPRSNLSPRQILRRKRNRNLALARIAKEKENERNLPIVISPASSTENKEDGKRKRRAEEARKERDEKKNGEEKREERRREKEEMKLEKEKRIEKKIEKKMEKNIEKKIEKQIEKKIDKSKQCDTPTGKLREIIIDGPNVAKAYTNGKFFSDAGLKIVIDFFKDKGHKVKAFVPQHVRNRNRQILENLNREGFVVFTPSRKAGSKCITPYDDRYILEYANKCDGIIISNDQFKDLYDEKPEWRDTIEKRILPPTFVGDLLMFPEDPLGRKGPKLDRFLRHDT